MLDKLKRSHVPSTHDLITNAEIIATYRKLVKELKIKENKPLEQFLTVKRVRSQSGVAIVTLLTMPYPCPGKCVYCPDEVRMPKSYIETEPAAARALTLHFDPYTQTSLRIKALLENGHLADKIEIIIKGGTWSSYPIDYQQWFIQQSLLAMNEIGKIERTFEYNPDSPYNRFIGEEKESWSIEKLLREQEINETATHRCVGLTIETRPDFVSTQEIKRLRLLGCTRVEIGLQTTDDSVLELIKRGHDSASTARATKLLRDAAFKVDYHLMPGLPGATPEGDLESAREVFTLPDYQPDTVKLYPCVVTPNTVMEQWWKDGTYIPYTTDQLVPLLAKIKALVPPWVRVSRVIRDIPSTEITAGNMATNLRENVVTYMKEHDLKCRCIRCREIGRNDFDIDAIASPVVRTFEAGDGVEHFLSYEDEAKSLLYAFLRLRFPSPDVSKLFKVAPELEGAALVRELHTYGQLVSINTHDEDASQHKGYGRRLLERAEEMAREAGYKKMAIIAGVGVREYYRKNGYVLEGTYMVKSL